MIEAIEIFKVCESRWDYDEYSDSKDSVIKTFRRRYEAGAELRRLEEELRIKKELGASHEDVRYWIETELVKPSESKEYERRPEDFKHIEEVEPIPDTCGDIRELYASPNVSLAYINLTGQAKKHKHHVMEEVYYVTKGKGYLTLEDKTYRIEEGDSINISKDKWHFLKTDKDSELELLVVTSPRFMPEDVIL